MHPNAAWLIGGWKVEFAVVIHQDEWIHSFISFADSGRNILVHPKTIANHMWSRRGENLFYAFCFHYVSFKKFKIIELPNFFH
jgi:hypothetical protein